MIMYHGTIKGYADSIVKDGIKPMPSQSFHVRNIPTPNGIYLTPSLKLATDFAMTRADYSQANPGEWFDVFNFMWKASTGQPKLEGVDVTPVVVKVEVPDTSLLEGDRDYIGPNEAYLCHCSIAPEHVKEVIPIPYGGD